MNLIALTGPKGVGKTTVAKLIQETKPGSKVMSFAGPLKSMLREILPPEAFTPEGKEDPAYGLCGRTPRYLMQTLGTEWGRNLVGDPVWIEVLRRQISTSGTTCVIIDDLRFENEAEMVSSMGGWIFRIVRPGVDYSGEHASEVPLDEAYIDGTIVNRSVEDVKAVLRMGLSVAALGR